MKDGKILRESYHFIVLTVFKNCSYFILWSIVWWRSCKYSMPPPSSSGLGHLSFKEAAGIRLPLGVGKGSWSSIINKPGSSGGRVLRKEVDHQLSISLEFFLSGSMPERLMGTDCKFVGNMSTLVQIQLGPKIRRSTTKWYQITHFGSPEILDPQPQYVR